MTECVPDDQVRRATTFSLLDKPSVVVRLVKHPVAPPSVSISYGLGDCACAGGSSVSPDEITELEFANRTLEKEWLLNPANPTLVVIDAPAGYGKTTLLKKVAEEYSKEGWSAAVVDLGVARDPVDVLDEIAEQAVCHSLKARHESEAVRELKMALAGKDVFLCFDRAEAGKETALWLRDHVIPGLREGLRGVQVRAVVAGRGISRGEWNWAGYWIRELSPFDWSIVQEMLERIGKDDPHTQRWQPEDYRRLALAVSRLSGGHPGVIKELIEEMVRKRWTLTLSGQERDAYFGIYVQETIQQMLKHYGFTDSQKIEIIKVMSVFRGINLSTFKALMRRGLIPEGDPMQILALFAGVGVLSKPKSGEIFYRDSILRGLILAQLEVKDRTRYLALNQVACEIYHDWIEGIKSDPDRIFLKPTYAIESLYHILQLEDWEAVVNELRYHRGHSTERQIQIWMGDDEEICRCAQELFERSVQELCRQAFNERFHVGPPHLTKKGDQEMPADPALIAVVTQASTLLIEIVRDVFKGRQEKRRAEEAAAEPEKAVEPKATVTPSTATLPIAQPGELENILQQIDLASQQIRIDTIKSIVTQLSQHKRNWNDFREEESKPTASATARIEAKQAREDEEIAIKDLSLSLKKHLEELTGYIIELPELE